MKEFECDPMQSPLEIIDSLVFSKADYLEKQKNASGNLRHLPPGQAAPA